ncbi:MAG: FGGY family carbohydrate kinase [Actinomycetota bacterium]|nr:FGGY family carbohydrate kinase [Actinomycetota bacterium]
MPKEFLLGIDAGTTYTKAALVTPDGAERRHGRARTPWRPVPTGAEMHPSGFVDAALEAVRAALTSGGGGPGGGGGTPLDGSIVAVGVTSMAETGVLLDRDGAPAAPCIAWHDTRGGAEADDLARAIGAPRFTAHTGLPASNLCSAAKLGWLRDNTPESSRGVRWLNVAEWLVHRLGGDQVAEPSLASRTGMLDVGRGTWWDDVLGWAGAPPRLMPDLTEAGAPAGRVDGPLPEAEGAVLTVAGHDHLCAAVGAGATAPGDTFNSCGTAEAYVRPLRPPVEDDVILEAVNGGVCVGCHVIPGWRALMGGFSAGATLQRFLDLLGAEDEAARAALESAALESATDETDLRVEGVGEEHMALTGITGHPSPAAAWRAVAGAVVERGAGILATIEAAAGDTELLVVGGGWSKSPVLRRLKAARLGPFLEPQVEEAGARGAALTAGRAAGLYPALTELPPVEYVHHSGG